MYHFQVITRQMDNNADGNKYVYVAKLCKWDANVVDDTGRKPTGSPIRWSRSIPFLVVINDHASQLLTLNHFSKDPNIQYHSINGWTCVFMWLRWLSGSATRLPSKPQAERPAKGCWTLLCPLISTDGVKQLNRCRFQREMGKTSREKTCWTSLTLWFLEIIIYLG